MAILAQTTPELTWLFKATFADGSVIEQDQSDASIASPGGSAFSDVLARPFALETFALHHIGSDAVVSVDLVTGEFTDNGWTFVRHEDDFDPRAHTLDLIYWRHTRVERDSDGAMRHYVRRYEIGWSCEGHEPVTISVG